MAGPASRPSRLAGRRRPASTSASRRSSASSRARQLRPGVLAAAGQLGARDLAAARELVAGAHGPAARPRRPARRRARARPAADPAVACSVRSIASRRASPTPRSLASSRPSLKAGKLSLRGGRPPPPQRADRTPTRCCPATPVARWRWPRSCSTRPAHGQPRPRPLGLHGATADGRELTIQSTGLGGPSVAVVLCGARRARASRRAIRVGTCLPSTPRLEPGDMLVVAARSSASRRRTASPLGPRARPARTRALLAALGGARPRRRVATTDLYYDPERGTPQRARWRRRAPRRSTSARRPPSPSARGSAWRSPARWSSAGGPTATRLGDDAGCEAASLTVGGAPAAAPPLSRGSSASAGALVGQLVEAVLDLLEPARERAQPALEALEVGWPTARPRRSSPALRLRPRARRRRAPARAPG